MKGFFIGLMAIISIGITAVACSENNTRNTQKAKEENTDVVLVEDTPLDVVADPKPLITDIENKDEDEMVPVQIDTVDFDSIMEMFDKLCDELSTIHIQDVADTLRIRAIMDSFSFDNMEIRENNDDLLHSQKVHYLRSTRVFINEYQRLVSEAVEAGIVWSDVGDDLEEFIEVKTMLEKEYYKETN